MKSIGIILMAMVVMTASSCKKEDPEPAFSYEQMIESTMTQIGSAISGSYTLTMYATEDLSVGYNKMYYLLKDADGELVSDYEIHSHPMMEMNTGMMHTTPHEQAMLIDEEHGLYETNVTFIMPSTAGIWSITASVEMSGESMEFDFEPIITSPAEARMLSFQSPDEMSYFLALVEPSDPEVGENDFEVVLYHRENMMSFPAVEDATFEIEPWMPSMGHGSPNNVNPTHGANGHYTGVVNFSMTGHWEVKMNIRNASGDLLVEELAMDITL